MGVDLRSLQIGQMVTVKEMNFGLQINLPGEGEIGLAVVEITPDYLVLHDAAGDSQRRIPLYLLNKSSHVPVENRAAA
jgi:hypothetical protein